MTVVTIATLSIVILIMALQLGIYVCSTSVMTSRSVTTYTVIVLVLNSILTMHVYVVHAHVQ